MAVSVGTAWVDIRPDLTRFSRDLRTEVTRDIAKAGDDAGRSLKTSLAGAAKSAAKGFAVAFAAVKVKDLFAGAIDAASDLNESLTKAAVVFGPFAGRVKSFADTAADAIGQSNQQALEATGTFGNLFVAMGFAQGAAADMSVELVTLASDLASFNNASPEDALTALRSGLVGETEPLKRFGVNLNEATLKTKALELGLKTTGGTLDPVTKAQAAYALILEQTTTAQGDYTRTADGLANRQRSLTATWADAKAELGEGLLPVMQAFTGFVTDELIPTFKTLFTSGGDATGWAATIRDVFGDVVGFVVGSLQTVLRVIANVFEKVPGPWGEGVADDMRTAADSVDAFRRAVHATKAEIAGWAGATLNADAAAALLADTSKDATDTMRGLGVETGRTAKETRDAAGADRDLRRARRDLAELEEQGVVDAEKLADARRDLDDATRGAASANRELTKAQKGYDEALAAANILGTDTANEALADASDNLADAQDAVADATNRQTDAQKNLAAAQAGDPDFQDKLADARDKVAEAQEKINAAEGQAVGAAGVVVAGVQARTAAVKALNDELGLTADHLGVFFGDAGNLLDKVPGLTLPPAQAAFVGPPFVGPPFVGPGQVPPSGTQGPAATGATSVKVDMTVLGPAPDPAALGRAIAWVL